MIRHVTVVGMLAVVAACCLAMALVSAEARAEGPDVRWVIFHSPGESWDPELGFREQPGVMEHVAHYRELLEGGRLALGGPYFDDSGGMMVFVRGVARDEAERVASSDPAVEKGLLTYELRQWLIAMSGE